MSNSSFVIELFERIHRLKVRNELNEYLYRLKHKCLFLLYTILLLCLFQCHTRIYNAWAGPFHLNLNEFITHWKIYSGNLSIEKSFSSNLFSISKEYLQIELGENKIDENPKHIYGVYHRSPTRRKLLYTFNPIKDQNITRRPMQLFVKLPTHFHSNFHQRLPYRFELFNSDTLRCIAQQIGISQEVYYSNFKNAMLIRLIEEIYDRNATDFNNKVIIKCGILLGYLYDYPSEIVFPTYSNQSYKFTYDVVVFNAYVSYIPYLIYLFVGLLLLCFLMRIFVDLLQLPWLVFLSFHLTISPNAQNALNIFNIDSIQWLDYRTMTTAKENNYHNQLFLVQDKYLIIFKINLNVCDPEILCQFYITAPFIIIDIERIIAINSNYISILNGDFVDQIPLPMINDNNNNYTVDWLHKRLMYYSTTYRQKMRKPHCLDDFINEEEQIQRIGNYSSSASPHAIAKFRFEGPQIVNGPLSETLCPICLETFQLGESYSQWPCRVQHPFHYDCMLNVLRRQDRCPLCLHIFEEKYLPKTDVDSESDYEVE